jgi:F-box protein 9
MVSSNLDILPLDVKQKVDRPKLIAENKSSTEYDVSAFIPSNPENYVFIGILPDELIVEVIKWNLFWDLSYYSKLSLTCKKMSALVKDQRIWRFCCDRIHTKEQLINQNSTWFNLWLTIPRIRVDGVYICRVTYTRQGLDESSVYTPVHLVIYYRYIRFFNSVVVMWTTPLEPKNAIKFLTVDSLYKKEFCMGKWVLFDAELIKIYDLLDKKVPRYVFEATLKISGNRPGSFNKLGWVNYTARQIQDKNSITNISTQLKPFIFSKVKSFPNYGSSELNWE